MIRGMDASGCPAARAVNFGQSHNHSRLPLGSSMQRTGCPSMSSVLTLAGLKFEYASRSISSASPVARA
jgi:hypothetical protein